MALGTFTLVERSGYMSSAPLFLDAINVVGDTSYATGGSAFSALYKAFKKHDRSIIAVLPLDCAGYIPAYNASNGKLKFYTGDNDNGADGPGVEVAAAANLSAITFKLLVISQ